MKRLFPFALGIILTLCSCNNEYGPENPQGKRDINIAETLSASQSEMVDIMTGKSFELMQMHSEYEANQENPKPNTIISPLGLWYSLGMLADGADGLTKEEILKGMGFENFSNEEIDMFFHSLSRQLMNLDSSVKFRVANSLWFRGDVFSHLQNNFVERMNKYYEAPCTNVFNFESNKTLDLINDWCNKATNGFISELYKDGELMSGDDHTLMLNVLYFNGRWKYKFNKSETKSQEFILENGAVSSVRMMHGTEQQLDFISNGHYSAVSLPFGNDGFSMHLILPGEDSDIESCLRTLKNDHDQLIRLSKGEVNKRAVKVNLPVLNIDYKTYFNDILQSGMGLGHVFEDSGNKSQINFFPMYGEYKKNDGFNSVGQTSKITVDENGAEAAVVTNTINSDSAPIEFNVNRPFIFIISETTMGLPIFMGRVTRP